METTKGPTDLPGIYDPQQRWMTRAPPQPHTRDLPPQSMPDLPAAQEELREMAALSTVKQQLRKAMKQKLAAVSHESAMSQSKKTEAPS